MQAATITLHQTPLGWTATCDGNPAIHISGWNPSKVADGAIQANENAPARAPDTSTARIEAGTKLTCGCTGNRVHAFTVAPQRYAHGVRRHNGTWMVERSSLDYHFTPATVIAADVHTSMHATLWVPLDPFPPEWTSKAIPVRQEFGIVTCSCVSSIPLVGKLHRLVTKQDLKAASKDPHTLAVFPPANR